MTRRIVTAREQVEMLSPWLREATPWRSKPGDPTYTVPTGDLLQHRQFNPAITTPEQYRDSVWTDSYDPDKSEPYRNNFTNSWSSGGGSEGSNEEDIVDAFEKGHKLPPVEIVTNGVGATLSDGNHRTEVADMMSQPNLESYIHYAPHNPDSFFQKPVDPNSGLGKQIHKLVQQHPYEPVEGGPTTDFVFRKHPETGEWQRGRVTDPSPHFVDTPEYHEQMKKKVRHFKPNGLGTYFDVDFGSGPEITHERQLYARNLMSGVTLYTKPGCPQCDMTKKRLDHHGIPHDVVDVTTDPAAYAHVTQNLGYSSAPVVDAGDGNHWFGFRPDRIKGLLG